MKRNPISVKWLIIGSISFFIIKVAITHGNDFIKNYNNSPNKEINLEVSEVINKGVDKMKDETIESFAVPGEIDTKIDTNIVIDKTKENDFEEIFTIQEMDKVIQKRINGISWKKGAPVGLNDLRYVNVTYWGFDNKPHLGELIVNSKVASEVIDIFKELYEVKFPIEKIKLIDEYGADDNLSMEDNNSSSFCYRVVEGTKNLSKHSYGVAIDINPVQNPYIRKEKISPPKSEEYLDRNNIRKGMIIKGDPCYNAFTKRGWIWGGEWNTVKDYQHFQKEIN